MKKVIFNADDFGLTDSVTDAIIESHINGIITSTTIIVNMDSFEYAAKKSKEISSLGVGIHLNLTAGKPVSPESKIPLLLKEDGTFKDFSDQKMNFILGKENYHQIKIELENQFSKLLDSGIMPTHYDSHHHITGLPLAFKASLELAKKYNLKRARITKNKIHFIESASWADKTNNLMSVVKNSSRLPIHHFNKTKLRKSGFLTPDIKVVPFRVLPKNANDIQHFINVLSTIRDGITEISLHPGYANSYPLDDEDMEIVRVKDFNICTSKIISDQLKILNIKKVHFGNAF